jgi:hypothetical protein
VLYRAINLAHIVFGPLVEQMLNVSLSDPVVLERFRDAAVDLLTHRRNGDGYRGCRRSVRPRGGGSSHEHVIITGSADPQAAGAALSRAGARFSGVTEDGREPSGQEWEALEEEVLATGRDFPYTPNWVSGVRLASRGPWCYVDCKGCIPPAMRERMIAVLVEELERAGVSCRVEVPSAGERDYEAPPMFPMPWQRV